MPSHRYHRALAKLVLGDDYELVNLIKDAPYKLYPGKKHREFLHDRETNLWLGLLLGPRAFLAGELHDWLDKNFVEDKETGKLIPRSEWKRRGRKARRAKTRKKRKR